MKNKKTIKRETKTGSFTTVSYSILRDNNLTTTSRLLLIDILSDTDDITLSQTLYCNRLGIDRKKFQRAILDLIENGYIRRKDISKPNSKGIHTRPIYHYTISEYGNLKPKEQTPPTKEDTVVTPEVSKSVSNEPLPIIDNQLIEELSSWVRDEIAKCTMYGTIKEKEVGCNQIVEYMIKVFKENPNGVNEQLIKKRVIYHNNKINATKTANANQEYLQ